MLISLSIAVVTAIVLIWNSCTQRQQLRTVQRQVQLMENEIKERLRPWLGVVGNIEPKYVFHKDGNLTYEQFISLSLEERRKLNLEYFAWEIPIKNYGSLPANDIRYDLIWSYEPMTKKNLDEIKLQLLPLYPLMPDQIGRITVQMPVEFMIKMDEEGKELFALFYVEYYFGDSKKAVIGHIYRFIAGRVSAIESWVE